MPVAGEPVTGPQARFRWERALRRDPKTPRYLKGFLLLIGTYMNGDGTGARPSAAQLCEDWEDMSRQRAFELLAEAEQTGWIVSVSRVGKATLRLPATPYPSDVSDGSVIDISSALADDPSDTSYGSTTPDPSDTSDGLWHNPSDTSDPTRQTRQTRQEQNRNNWGRAAPRPPTSDPGKAPGSNEQPLPARADGPVANSSPKRNPPPARTTRAARRKRGKPPRAGPRLEAVPDLGPTGSDP